MAPANAEQSSLARDAVPEHADETTWSVDPARPGADLPPMGRSLFDFLLAQRAGANPTTAVPFPFSALLRRISDTTTPDAAGRSSIRAVLIPLGRSLQRSRSEEHTSELQSPVHLVC